ncbi:MAG TPA: acetylxylan esterase [Mucilaginibacter sp.]|jgi:cephalosporin-C deacetylase|nr:acetylxylan esterase [Mucilaginibacter sp.]
MTSFSKKFTVIVCLVITVSGLQHAFGQKQTADTTKKRPQVIMSLSPAEPDTTFSTNAYYSVNLLSTFATDQSGTLSYLLTGKGGKKIKAESMHVKLAPTCPISYAFSIPTIPAGAYKINFTVTVPGYQDTISSTFKIKSDESRKDSVINMTLTPHSDDGIFSTNASYTLSVSNTFPSAQKATLSYLVTTEAGKKVKADSIHVKIGTSGIASYDFNIPPAKPGFYKINFMVAVPDYTDTIRRAFGIKPALVRSQHAKPADFDAFWQQSKAELAKVKPEYKVTEIANCKDNRRVFEVEMRSLDGLLIRGFLTEPKNHSKTKKFAVLLGLPGYQVALGPMYGSDPDIAIFTLNIRGNGYSRDVISVRRESYIVLNLEDKNRYVLRGAIMDCVRAVDFIYSRPELRHDNIIAAGGSLGGFLAIATSGVDNRINFCSAANPIMCDVRNLPHEVDWPLIDINLYIKTRPGLTMDKVMDNLDYFDGKNFASGIKCPTLVGLGMVDNIAPPDHVYNMYNEIRADKHIIIFRDLAHEIGRWYNVYEGRWMRDTFALF